MCASVGAHKRSPLFPVSPGLWPMHCPVVGVTLVSAHLLSIRPTLLSSSTQGSCLSETQAHGQAVDMSRLPAQTFSEENLKMCAFFYSCGKPPRLRQFMRKCLICTCHFRELESIMVEKRHSGRNNYSHLNPQVGGRDHTVNSIVNSRNDHTQ